MVRLVVAVLAVLTATCLADHPFNEKYPFSLTLDNDNYYVYWNFSLADETIQFGVRAKTEGWVGFGISPNGQMPGSDVVIGWVDGDEAYFHDRYAEERVTPPIDAMQDWFLISAAINDGYTELEFSRNFTTCDNESKDLDILADTSRVVYSWQDQKPTVIDRDTYTLLRHSDKGSASVNLLSGLPTAPAIPDNAQQFTVGVTDAELPSADTTYWCRGFSMESLVGNPNDTRYVIKFGPSISEGSEDYVHHVLVYTCNGLTEEDLGSGGPCHEQNDELQACRGDSGVLIATWAIGGIDFTYPDNVAYPIGGDDGGKHRYFVIELHYNNPEMKSGIIDNSGLVFTYLDEPRQHNAGILFFGHQVRYTMVIPPSAQNYTIPALCPSECTEQFLPAGGIKIFANMLHTHLAGTGLSLSVLRQNDTDHYEEIRPIDKNLRYDFNFQQVTHLPEEITVLPGDDLLLQCFYDTSTRTEATFGGESTEEEMCLSFPIYYPRTEMLNCESVPVYNEFTDFVLNDVPVENRAAFAILAVDGQFTRENIANAVNPITWTNQLAEDLENNVYVKGNQYSYCYSANDDYFDRTGVIPEVSKYYSKPAPVRNCTVESRPDGASPIQVSVMVLLTFTALSSYILLR